MALLRHAFGSLFSQPWQSSRHPVLDVPNNRPAQLGQGLRLIDLRFKRCLTDSRWSWRESIAKDWTPTFSSKFEYNVCARSVNVEHQIRSSNIVREDWQQGNKASRSRLPLIGFIADCHMS